MTDVANQALPTVIALLALGVSIVAAIPAFVGLAHARERMRLPQEPMSSRSRRIGSPSTLTTSRAAPKQERPNLMTWNGLSAGSTSTASSSPTKDSTLRTMCDSAWEAHGVLGGTRAPRSLRHGRTSKCPVTRLSRRAGSTETWCNSASCGPRRPGHHTKPLWRFPGGTSSATAVQLDDLLPPSNAVTAGARSHSSHTKLAVR